MLLIVNINHKQSKLKKITLQAAEKKQDLHVASYNTENKPFSLCQRDQKQFSCTDECTFTEYSVEKRVLLC